jgi:hypothetical protein
MSAQFPVPVFEDVGHRRLHLSAFIRRRYLGRLQALVCYQTPATEAQRPRPAKPGAAIHSRLRRVTHKSLPPAPEAKRTCASSPALEERR